MLVLAGDIGGTNARLALFDIGEATSKDAPSPAPSSTCRCLVEKVYPSAEHPGLDVIAEKFLTETRDAWPTSDPPQKACLGIAGPVEGNVCRATNLPWVVDGRVLSQRLRIPHVRLVNDFLAAALGSLSVPADQLTPIGGGPRDPKGPVAVLGAGTGLGEAFLLWSPSDDRYQVVASEGGHTDFAPRTPLEIGLLAYLTAKFGRVSYERVLSGQGLTNLYAFLSDEPAFRALRNAATVTAISGDDPAAVISQRALDGSDPISAAALTIFSAILGARAGNLALTFLATGGVFVAGGIAPRVLPILQRGAFREAFERKGRLQPLVARIPAFVVMHPQPGLLGAATVAASL